METILNNNKYTKEFRESIKYFEKKYIENGNNYTIKVKISYNDECNNGHNTFHITGDIYEKGKFFMGGCIHDEIEKHFPEFKKYIKWHGTHTDGPLYYIANTTYWAEKGELENARKCAIWDDATLEQLKNKEVLIARLPKLMEEFQKDILELGFTY